MKHVIIALFILVAAAGRVDAQVPSTATPLAPAFAAGCEAKPVLDLLTLRNNQGDWSAFQREARALLDALRGQAPAPPSPIARCAAPAKMLTAEAQAALDYRRRHVALVWVGADALGKVQLMRAIVRWPEPEPYSADLPGLAGLTEVLVAGSVSARGASLYVSTADKDPFAQVLPQFVETVFAPLSATLAGILGRVRGGREAREFDPASTPPHLGVTISHVVLPVARATIRLQTKVRDLVTAAEFTDAVGRLGTTLLFDGAGRSNLARAQITTIVNDLPVVAAKSCAADGSAVPPQVACRNALDGLLKTAFDTAVAGKPSNADATAIERVDQQFRALAVNALAVNGELEITFKNRPRTHFSFGAGSAVMVHASVNRVRAKLNESTGNLASDPLPRVMTMAFVNWSPRGYDEASSKLRASERVRAFVGAALTPDFGLIGGVNVLLVRGIGIVGGAGALFGKGAEADEVGKAPAASNDPFKLATSKVAFVGISYSYR